MRQAGLTVELSCFFRASYAGYWPSIWSCPVNKWRAALLGRKTRPLPGAKHLSIDKGNALVCLSEIAVRGPFAAESRLCFIPCSGGTVILEYLQLGAETETSASRK